VRGLRDALAAVKMPAMAIPDPPTLAPAARRVMLAVAALVLGIGSCQLPQPHLPKLPVGGVADVGAARASTLTPGDRT